MYCINCGAKLADTEACCPLCGTDPLNPKVERAPKEPLYPKGSLPDISPKNH